MCLGIPGRIVEVWDEASGARMARVDFAGQPRRVCLAYLPDLRVGEYVIVHAGFALTKVDEAAALAALDTMAEYGVIGRAAADQVQAQVEAQVQAETRLQAQGGAR